MSEKIEPPKTQEEADRLFAERLQDWNEPGAIIIFRNGVPLDDSGRVQENSRPTPPTVNRVDEDGNIYLSDGTVVP